MKKEAPRVSVPNIRRPRQKRSQERFQAILDAAERALWKQEPGQISIYTLADEADMTPASLYHFFPDAQYVLVALAERYYEGFAQWVTEPLTCEVSSWQDVMDCRANASVEFYNNNDAARKLLLGSALTAALRSRDVELDRLLAERYIEELKRLFVTPEIPNWVDRATETIVINDALWSLSVHMHGVITEEASEQARRARIAYARTYLPEYLPLRKDAERRLKGTVSSSTRTKKRSSSR